MFCGIIEQTVELVHVERDGGNKEFFFHSSIVNQLAIDQSISHNGVCLTIVWIGELKGKQVYRVTAMEETLMRSNLDRLNVGNFVNFERSMRIDGRLDGHIVQGHVDTIAHCVDVVERNGSWVYTFEHPFDEDYLSKGYYCVDKGSIAVNGVSLTICDPIVDADQERFSVNIIPYTYENTNFKYIKTGEVVNIEFDIIGKYLARYNNIYAR